MRRLERTLFKSESVTLRCVLIFLINPHYKLIHITATIATVINRSYILPNYKCDGSY